MQGAERMNGFDFPNAFSLKGRVALITGGATGLGLATARCMLAAGAKVVVASSSPQEKYADIMASMGKNAFYRQFDVTDTDGCGPLVEEIVKTHGALDILCNNAGIHRKKPVEEMSVEDFMDVLNVHLKGAYALSRAALAVMRGQEKGSILFIGSMTSYIGMTQVTGYSAAKSGVLGLMRALCAEVSDCGIRVNAIAPGWIDTPMFRKATDNDPKRREKILGRTPMACFGDPADVGWAAVYLSSDAAAFVNGAVLPVDGGALIGF